MLKTKRAAVTHEVLKCLHARGTALLPLAQKRLIVGQRNKVDNCSGIVYN